MIRLANKIKFYVPVAGMVMLFMACKPHIDPAALYGKWKYTRVEHPKALDSLNSAELQSAAPHILFSKEGRFEIIWDGKILSHGRFKLKDKNIMITETLPDSTKRDFIFGVNELDDKKIIFQTYGEDESVVTAVKF